VHIWICSYVEDGGLDYGLPVREGWGYEFVSTRNADFGVLTCGGANLYL
jgi:hypothetical protein